MYLSTAVLTRLSIQSVWVALERAKIGLIPFFFEISSFEKNLSDGVRQHGPCYFVKRKHWY